MSTVRMRRWGHDEGTVIEVELEPAKWGDGWTVWYEGTVIGTVGSYMGSLDRPAGRLRIPGKRRKLWWSKPPGEGQRSMRESVSRADAIRNLLR